MTEKLTRGTHHIGLAVRNLDEVRSFFCDLLGWDVVNELPAYPAVFVSDGSVMLTLWQVADPDKAIAFDRRANIGLHHLALCVSDEAALTRVYERISRDKSVAVELAPEPIAEGASTRHFICAIPGGIRLEFATPFV